MSTTASSWTTITTVELENDSDHGPDGHRVTAAAQVRGPIWRVRLRAWPEASGPRGNSSGAIGHGTSWQHALQAALEEYRSRSRELKGVNERLTEDAATILRDRMNAREPGRSLAYLASGAGDLVLLLDSDERIVALWKVTPEILHQFLDDDRELDSWKIQDARGLSLEELDAHGEVLASRGESGFVSRGAFYPHLEKLLDLEPG